MPNMIMESIGVYLPPNVVTTEEIVQGCRNPIQFPLELLTGIRSRRMAGDGEFSMDLAEKAIVDCLQNSRFHEDEIDLLICCNISRYDQPLTVTYEPSTAATLKQRLGLRNALAFDIANACAGMFTGLLLAESLLGQGWATRALVASGEYITHLTRSAQQEIESFMDRRLASLTLGDAGAAVTLELSPADDVGFQTLDLFTLGKYHPLCIAKPSEHGGVGTTMVTDPIQATAVFIERSALHAQRTLQQADWSIDSCQHIIPHQTSKTTIREALSETERLVGVELEKRTICNLTERGNTGSNTHFVALKDQILNQRIRAGDRTLFCITGAGITIGTALYTFDDLPDRLRNGSHELRKQATTARPACLATCSGPPSVNLTALATVYPDGSSREARDTRHLARRAAETCLAQCGLDRNEIDLLISIGVYRTDFLAEPAAATMAASDLDTNADCSPLAPRKTLAFDLQNGPLGFLNACGVATAMMHQGRCHHAMIIAAETEDGGAETTPPPRGLREMGSAVMLEVSPDAGAGFVAFHFQDFPEHLAVQQVVARQGNQGTHVQYRCAADWQDRYRTCIGQVVRQLLAAQDLDISQIQAVFPPQISGEFIGRLADTLGARPD